jgi:hypothetical protein
MSLFVEVRDQNGGSVSATICPITGYIVVLIPGRPPALCDQDDPEVVDMLHTIFRDQIDILLERNGHLRGGKRS